MCSASLLCLTTVGRAHAEGIFIPAADRVDIAHDLARHTLYVSNSGSVLRYDTMSNEFLAPWSLGGDLTGMDISPDGNVLVVADRSYSDDNVWIHTVDLEYVG